MQSHQSSLSLRVHYKGDGISTRIVQLAWNAISVARLYIPAGPIPSFHNVDFDDIIRPGDVCTLASCTKNAPAVTKRCNYYQHKTDLHSLTLSF